MQMFVCLLEQGETLASLCCSHRLWRKNCQANSFSGCETPLTAFAALVEKSGRGPSGPGYFWCREPRTQSRRSNLSSRGCSLRYTAPRRSDKRRAVSPCSAETRLRGGGKQINLLTRSLAGTRLFVTEDTESKGLTEPIARSGGKWRQRRRGAPAPLFWERNRNFAVM